MKNFEESLPNGYVLAKTVDAKDTKLSVIFNVIAVVVAIVVVAVAWLILQPDFREGSFLHLFAFSGILLSYIVLHELVHGIAYKLLTGRKLTFGLTLTVAYCGVPDILVYRKTALIALLAPFVTFTIVFGTLTFFIPDTIFQFIFAAILGFHLGGCSGDLYDTILYVCKFKSPDTLMQDTGPTQYFYVKAQEQSQNQ